MKTSWQLAEEKRAAARILHKTSRQARLKIRRKDTEGSTTRRTPRRSAGLHGCQLDTWGSASV
jgi:hypothetical protein